VCEDGGEVGEGGGGGGVGVGGVGGRVRKEGKGGVIDWDYSVILLPPTC